MGGMKRGRMDNTSLLDTRVDACAPASAVSTPAQPIRKVRPPSGEPPAERLRATQARLAGILDIADDAIIAVDDQHRITFFNQGAEKIFGYTAPEVLDQPLDLLLPPRFRTLHRRHLAAFATSPDVARRMGERQDIYGQRKDGSEFPAEASIA